MATNRFPVSSAPGCVAPVDVLEDRVFHDRPEQPRTRLVTDILVISDGDSIANYLKPLFRRSGWTFATRRACAEGISFVNQRRAAVAICDEVLRDGCWQDLALAFSAIPDAPALIVISDNPALIREVMALGGFDVLARPLGPEDVLWSVASAWHAWWKRYGGRHGGVQCFDA